MERQSSKPRPSTPTLTSSPSLPTTAEAPPTDPASMLTSLSAAQTATERMVKAYSEIPNFTCPPAPPPPSPASASSDLVTMAVPPQQQLLHWNEHQPPSPPPLPPAKSQRHRLASLRQLQQPSSSPPQPDRAPRQRRISASAAISAVPTGAVTIASLMPTSPMALIGGDIGGFTEFSADPSSRISRGSLVFRRPKSLESTHRALFNLPRLPNALRLPSPQSSDEIVQLWKDEPSEVRREFKSMADFEKSVSERTFPDYRFQRSSPRRTRTAIQSTMKAESTATAPTNLVASDTNITTTAITTTTTGSGVTAGSGTDTQSKKRKSLVQVSRTESEGASSPSSSSTTLNIESGTKQEENVEETLQATDGAMLAADSRTNSVPESDDDHETDTRD
ncbi:hypothetical protein BGZ83_010038 [Gryganskiella cystojenkinii]|nr:hypothetical protein BGZ83_010038 [Gryganskiella cystojenkinii]